MFTSHKEASVLWEGKYLQHSNSSLGCDISQAVKSAALLHINLILDLSALTEAAFVFSFTFDKLVQLKGTLQRLVQRQVRAFRIA